MKKIYRFSFKNVQFQQNLQNKSNCFQSELWKINSKSEELYEVYLHRFKGIITLCPQGTGNLNFGIYKTLMKPC